MARKLFPSTWAIALTLLLAATGTFAAQPTNKAPVVTAFDVPDNSASPIPILTFTATDSDGTIAGYPITEASTKPSATAADWSAARPTQYTTSSVGTIHTSLFESSDSRYTGGTLVATWGSQVILNNVVVDGEAALALQVEIGSAVQAFGGRYVGDMAVGSNGGDLKAVGAQFTGAITSTDTMTMTNCIDGNFAPIPNIATP